MCNRDVLEILLRSPRTQHRVDTKFGLKDADAEATTVARANACSFAVMIRLMSTVVPSQLQLNVDDTQFCVCSMEKESDHVYIYIERERMAKL